MAWLGTGQAGLADEVPPHAFVGVDLEDAAQRLAARPARPAPGRRRDLRARRRLRPPRPRPRPRGDAPGASSCVDPAPLLLVAVQGERRAARGVRGADAASLVDDLRLPDADGPLPSVAVPDDAVDLEVDVLPVRDEVLAALRAHATQVQAVRAVDDDPALVGCYALSNRVLAPLLPVEAYRVAGRRRRRVAARCAPDSLTACATPRGPAGQGRPDVVGGVVVGAIGTIMHRSVQPWGARPEPGARAGGRRHGARVRRPGRLDRVRRRAGRDRRSSSRRRGLAGTSWCRRDEKIGLVWLARLGGRRDRRDAAAARLVLGRAAPAAAAADRCPDADVDVAGEPDAAQ